MTDEEFFRRWIAGVADHAPEFNRTQHPLFKMLPKYPLNPWTMSSRIENDDRHFYVFDKFNKLVARTTTFEAAQNAKRLIDGSP